ncbi:MAG: hypothetical protein ABI822_20385, partial [Bryobacteraceae bacterium]
VAELLVKNVSDVLTASSGPAALTKSNAEMRATSIFSFQDFQMPELSGVDLATRSLKHGLISKYC